MCAKLVIFALRNNHASISHTGTLLSYDMKSLSLLYSIPSWLITAIVAIVITLLLLLPQPLPDDVYQIQWFEGADKVVHALMFAALGAAIVTDTRLSKATSRWACTHKLAIIVLATLAATAYGGVMEVVQTLLAMGRDGSWGDLAADAIGAAAGSSLFGLIRI